MKVVTIAPWIMNVDLIKDVGKIPYYLMKKFDLEAEIVTMNNDIYSYIETEAKGLKINILSKKAHNNKMDLIFKIICYLLRESKKIDILNVYHVRTITSIYVFFYLLINKRGKVYLKCDIARKDLQKINKLLKSHSFFSIVKKIAIIFLLTKSKLVSVECKSIYDTFERTLSEFGIKTKLLRIPNGFDVKNMVLISQDEVFSRKENIILHVGRIGSFQKRSDLVLEAFKNIDSDWKLVLIGPIEKGFENYINKFLHLNQNMVDRIIVVGPIYERVELYNWYIKSRIFCLPSEYEGFSLALIEALYFLNYLVATNLDCTSDITQEGKYGLLIDKPDEYLLSEALKNAIELSETNFLYSTKETSKLIERSFNWEVIADTIYNKLFQVNR